MNKEDKINIDLFKVVTRAIGESYDLGIMTNHLTQLLVGALGIKACTMFALNFDTRELEILASFGLSLAYLNKGPVLADKSVRDVFKGEPIVIEDVTKTDQIQYPKQALQEGIKSMVSVPIKLYGQALGVLRLYHSEPWDVSKRDLDSLEILAENIGLAMMYTRLLNTIQSIRETINELPGDIAPLLKT
ncbi:MAG: GAF domain-containing protein [Deltaproteobacteria bacterium]|nr:GAF domain-containing protein [Deltaproteobacteria bacterium]